MKKAFFAPFLAGAACFVRRRSLVASLVCFRI
jgi:hypothetical protein